MKKFTILTTILGLSALTLLIACDKQAATNSNITVTELDTPTGPNSGEPNLCSTPNNSALFSWIEKDSLTSSLKFASWQSGSWSEASLIATGDDWFCNWADFPAMAALSNDNYIASWLAKSSAGTYSYDIYLAQSADAGLNWTDGLNPHDDGTPTEHGFVAMQPLGENSYAVTWLDGRETINEDGAMTLRYATLSSDGSLSDETVVDTKVCDCCQTAMTIAGDGSILITYRDRSDTEMRDISIVRLADGGWSEPAWVSVDGWQIEGCPVNGPAMDASDSLVVVSWFTMGADESDRVYTAFSSDNGQSFSKPIRIDSGETLGRVDVVMIDRTTALVSWLEASNDTTHIAVRTVNPDGVVSAEVTVANTSKSRSSGFARMAVTPEGVLIGWSDVAEPPTVKSALIKFE